MASNEISGVCPIIATPFTDSGEVDYSGVRNEIRALAEGGCHAVALFGIASEFFKLTDDEREQLIDIVTDECKAVDMPLVISITHESTEVAVQRALEAEAAGADCIMVYPPSFLGPSEAGIYNHVKEIGEAVTCPVMVQYAPDDSGVTIDPEVFVQMSNDQENIKYFKIECSPPGPYITHLLEETERDIDVFVGNHGLHMIDVFDRGGVGVMPGSALYDLYITIYDDYRNGNRDAALQLHGELVALLNQVEQVSGIRYNKKILKRRGVIDSDYCRKPLASPDDFQMELFEYYYEQLTQYFEE